MSPGCCLAASADRCRADRSEERVPELEATAAAQEAVFNTLEEAERKGLARDHADRFSLTVDYVEAIDFDPTA